MRRAAIAVLLALPACGGGGSKQAETTSTTVSTTTSTTASTSTTTMPTTTTVEGVASGIVLDNAGVTVTILRFRLAPKSDSKCDLTLQVDKSTATKCLTIDFTISAAADLAADEGSVVFDSYVTPDGTEDDSVFINTVRPGATKSYSAMFSTATTGGKVFGDLGISNKDTEKFTLDVPAF